MSDVDQTLVVGAVQMAPVFLDRAATLDKVERYVDEAGANGCALVAFGETLVPGYPFWLGRTDGARFNSDLQREIHSLYLREAVQIEAGHLDGVREAARRNGTTVVLGVAETPADRGGHSIYCSAVTIDAHGDIASVHRKLTPTYEERLSWASGDGHGLVTHEVAPFTVGSLNCWENWMPLSRTALYTQGEDLHVALWPGDVSDTADITRFIALESRSYVISASSVLRREHIPDFMPGADMMREASDEQISTGGTCIAAPDGSWVVEPVDSEEGLSVATLDHRQVRRERQNFDPAGHYGRPDVTRLVVDRRRQALATFTD
ncbi:carbon-nitrogen hydrolase family protein [Mycobacterium yunnanensis]|uniref:Carbon-nitrogen hydrolase family protein n=1 Tax=Mycobacterium yunnanensis TaxID=368477 RepID=A0A9X3C201_9MYCO|nr:carbon-nitrogen hydrolase family protein [Mycobacterium yunnanensis]MCV7420606.1 carbon-nitrogen hydrolase family protein [Mycobacterium yunnanensis]